MLHMQLKSAILSKLYQILAQQRLHFYNEYFYIPSE